MNIRQYNKLNRKHCFFADHIPVIVETMSAYSRRMAQLSARIFGEQVRNVPSKSNKVYIFHYKQKTIFSFFGTFGIMSNEPM